MSEVQLQRDLASRATRDTAPKQVGPHCSCSFSAEEVADALIDKLADPDTAAKIMDVWGGRVDQQLGKGLRRFALYVILGVLSLGAMKLGLFEKFFLDTH